MAKRKAVFLDRDGVVNRRLVGDYVKRWEEFEFLPEIFQVLPEIRRAGFLALLVTNQRGIARGMMTEEDLAGIHRRMQEELFRRSGEKFDGIYYCPHDRDEGCDCRKPKGGMILQGGREFDLDLGRSWMIGDAESDVEAGIAAGCLTGRIAPPGTATKALLLGDDLLSVWEQVCGDAGEGEDL